MNPWFSVNDGSALYGILAEVAGDIILKTDPRGFIEYASPNLDALGVDLASLLIAPHIADLADPSYRPALSAYFEDARRGAGVRDRAEFPLPRQPTEKSGNLTAASNPRPGRQWFALRIRSVPRSGDEEGGALGLLRALEPRLAGEQYWSRHERIDQLTGIANRCAFIEGVGAILEANGSGTVALFEIDAFRALCLRLGLGAGDEMIRAFADFMGVLLHDGEMIARFDDHKFALFMPGCAADDALARAREIIATFADLSRGPDTADVAISASAGLAQLSGTLRGTLSRAERALILASAAGGARAELFELRPAYLNKAPGPDWGLALGL